MGSKDKKIPKTPKALRGFVAAECIKQKPIAQKMGVCQQRVSDILRERYQSTPKTIQRLREAIRQILRERERVQQ